MREFYMNVSQRFGAGKLAKSLKRHSQKLRAVVAAMAMIFIAAPFYGQTWNLVTDASDLEVGDSVIIVSGDYALGTTQNTNNRAAVAITNNENDVEFNDEAGVQGIKLVEGTEDNTFGFYVGNGYLYAASSSSNHLKTQEELDANGSWLVTISGGVTTVVAQGTNTRNHVRYNPNNGSPVFSCYGATSTQQTVSIYKYEEGASSISLTQSLVDFSYNINNGPSAAQSFSVEGSNLTADITVSVPDDADFELCATEDGTYASSITITPSEGTVASTDVFVRMKAGLGVGAYNATITIASTGATSKTISLTGSVVDPDAVYYTAVTEAPATDWTGEYLITYTNGNVVKALAGSGGTSTIYGTEEDISEYLVGNKIIANATTDAIKVTARSTSNGYTLYLENVGYLGWNSGNSLEFDETVTDGRNEWTFSVSGEVVSITNVGTDNRSIKYNSSANPKRFACYTSGQSAITLYKSPREVQELIANPTFNPAEGTFFNSVDVTLACETDGTTIYYTLDGTDPTDASTAYTEAIHITETTTVKAIAIKNSASSEIVSATYTITDMEIVATPTINPDGGEFETSVEVTLACETADASIYYTLDGTDPTAESTLYDVPFVLNATTTVKAIAIKESMNNSTVAEATFTKVVSTAATPTITPNGGNFVESIEVTLACETEGAAIYYTLNGETPTTESTLYNAPFTLAETTTVKAIAIKEGMNNSTVAEATFTKVVPTAATPTITPNGGNFVESVEVSLACETEDATIYYTLDGTDPTAESTLYAEAFTLTETTTVKAIAVKENMQNSAIAVATFTKVEPAVAVNYTRITSLSQLQDGDKVIIAARYDDNADHYYVAPTRIANNRFNGVEVTAENEIITTEVDSVVWTVKETDGVYKFVNASNDTLGYGTSGTAFTSASNKEWTIAEYTNVSTALIPGYTGYKITNVANTGRSVALSASNNNVFGAYANSNAENNNAAQYNFALDFFVDLGDHAPLVATPTFSVPAGNYSSAQNVEILCATEGATIRYTLDGTDPTEESAEYTAALTISEPTTVKAKAYKQDYIASGIAEAFYNVNTTPTITVDAETLSFENVNETKTVNVSSFNLTEDITVAVSENFTVDAETITMNTDATLTVTFVGNAATTGTLTLTSGETVKTVALVATPLVASEGCYYPIADALTDWTGDYLITYTDLTAETINALNGIHENNYGLYENVYEYYADGIIASNLNTEMCKVTIEPTEDGKYSMYLNRNGYLGLSSEGNKLYSNSTFTAERDEWTITAENGVVTLTSVKYPARQLQWNNAQSGLRFACYTGGQTPVTLYKLGAVPAVATPVFTPVAGYYEEAQNVTITCATEGATIYYTTDGSAPTNESTQYTGAIAVSQNTTIKAIAILGDDESFVATARYTFPNFVENIAALYAVENTTDTYVLTGDVTFVYRNGKNMYVKDETAGLLLFDRNEVVTTEYTEGDVISGGITGTISMYHGMLEFIPTFNTAVSTQNTGAVVPTVITVEQLLSNAYVSQLVKVENVNIAEGTTYAEGQTGSNVTFSQNGSEALLRNSFKTLDMEIGDNTNWDITGFAAIYDSDIQIFPRDNDDVTIVTSVEELTAEISIYPNPTSNVINIAANGMNVERVELANVDGQIVSSETVASDMVTLSLEAQPAGMYFVRIYTADEVIVRKVTKF